MTMVIMSWGPGGAGWWRMVLEGTGEGFVVIERSEVLCYDGVGYYRDHERVERCS